MKDYVKPTIEIVELRPEERLATCYLGLIGPNIWIFLWELFCGKSKKSCNFGFTNAGGCS